MKKKEIYSIAVAIKQTKDNADKAYNEFTNMNKAVLTEIESIPAEYEAKRIDIIEANCEKNDDGSPVIENNNYVIIKGKEDDVQSQIDELSVETEKLFQEELEKEIK